MLGVAFMIASSKILAIGVILGVLSDPVILGMLALAGTVVTATVTVILALKGTNRKIDELKVNTDGKLSELMRTTSRADLAEGKLAGKAEEKMEALVIAAAMSKPDVSAPVAAPSASAPNIVTTNVPALSLVAKDVTVTKKSI